MNILLVHIESGYALSLDGKNLALEAISGGAKRSNSWMIERGESWNPSHYWIRTAVDAELSARYLGVSKTGGAVIHEHTTLDDPIMIWDLSANMLGLPIDGVNHYLYVDDSQNIQFGKLQASSQQEYKWRLEAGFVDHAQWQSATGQAGWAMCMHCGGNFWTGQPGRCWTNGDGPHQAGSQRFILPKSNPFARGIVSWRHCTKCSLLFNAPLEHVPVNTWTTSKPIEHHCGVCADGSAHSFSPKVSYTIAQTKSELLSLADQSAVANEDWRECTACNSMIWSKVLAGGHCPATKKGHQFRKSFALLEWKHHTEMETVLRKDTSKPFVVFDQVVNEALVRIISEDHPVIGKQLGKYIGNREAFYIELQPSELAELISALSSLKGNWPPDIDAKLQAELEQARVQLTKEADIANFVRSFYKAVSATYRDTFIEEGILTNQVQAFIKAETYPQQAHVNVFDLISSIVGALLGLIPGAGPILRAGTTIIEAASKAVIESSVGQGWDGRDSLLAADGFQFKILAKRFEAQLDQFDLQQKSILSNWGRLQIAARIDLTPTNDELAELRKSLVAAYKISIYQQLMPLRWYRVQASPAKKLLEGKSLHGMKLKDAPHNFYNRSKALVYDEKSSLVFALPFRGKAMPAEDLKWKGYFPSEAIMEDVARNPDGSIAPLNYMAMFEGTGGWEGFVVVSAWFGSPNWWKPLDVFHQKTIPKKLK